MNEITLLNEEQVFGANCLDILKRYGRASEITDFAILLGGNWCSQPEYNNGLNVVKNQCGNWYTKSLLGLHTPIKVSTDGAQSYASGETIDVGIRPVLPLSQFPRGLPEHRNSLGILEIEYGEYPHNVVNQTVSNELERNYFFGILKTTGKKYTINKNIIEGQEFSPQTLEEYEFNGKKFIRYISKREGIRFQTLSDKSEVEKGKVYWIEVKPVKWLVDEKSLLAISEKTLVSGISFGTERFYRGTYEESIVKHYLDSYFSNELFQSVKVINKNDMNLASTYIIVRDGEKFVLKKIVGTSFVDVNQEEINFIMKSLINQSLNIDTIINTIISMIDTNSISSSEELENYINGLSLSVEDKMNLYNKCIVYINSNNNKL